MNIYYIYIDCIYHIYLYWYMLYPCTSLIILTWLLMGWPFPECTPMYTSLIHPDQRPGLARNWLWNWNVWTANTQCCCTRQGLHHQMDRGRCSNTFRLGLPPRFALFNSLAVILLCPEFSFDLRDQHIRPCVKDTWQLKGMFEKSLLVLQYVWHFSVSAWKIVPRWLS